MKHIIFILISFALFACKKEEQPATLTENLAKNDWRKTSVLVSVDSIAPDTIPTVDILSPKPDCAKDNIWHFDAATKTFTLSEGPSKCNISDPDIKDQGTITEQNNGAQLKVAGSGTNEIWEIESFTASAFHVSYFARKPDNKLAKFRVTFSKI
ncbi:MAG: hypothetical protein U0T69_04705 [Chitinophagales bacterium]